MIVNNGLVCKMEKIKFNKLTNISSGSLHLEQPPELPPVRVVAPKDPKEPFFRYKPEWTIEDHPKYYERGLHDGFYHEVIAELCEEFPYVMEFEGIPHEWFFKRVRSRFTYASKDASTICYFFDDPWEAQKLHDDFIQPKLDREAEAIKKAASKKLDKKAALRAKMAAKGL